MIQLVLIYNGLEILTNALNLNELRKVYNEPTDGRAYYTESFEGEVSFTKSDFTFLNSVNQDPNLRCANISVLIQQLVSGSPVNVGTGFILPIDGSWDQDRCSVKIKLRVENRTDFLKEDKEVNVFDSVSEAQRITVNLTPLEQEEDTDGFELQIYSYSNSTDAWVPPFGGSSTPMAMAYVLTKKTINRDYGPQDWVMGNIFCQNLTTPTITYYYVYQRWVKWIPIADPIPPGTIDTGETDGSGNKKVARAPAVSDSPTETASNPRPCVGEQSYTWEILESSAPPTPPPVENVDNGLTLQAVLSVLLAPYNLTPKSDFFNIDPSDQLSETINYVTGEASTTANIVMFQKSDIKKPNQNNSNRFNISAKKLLDNLVNMFNLRFDVNGGVLLIEHISFFTKDATIDLRGSEYRRYIRNKYSYNQESVPAKEQFAFMEKRPENRALNDFNGVPIIYDRQCVKTDTKIDYAADIITTDVPWVLNTENAEKISDDGFVMMACNKDEEGNLHVIRKAAIIGFSREINNPLGWAHLHADFWKYGRFMDGGNMNTVNTLFLRPKPIKIYERFSIPFCDINGFNPNSEIKLPFADSVVQSASYNFKTGMIELQLASSGSEGGESTVVYLKITTENPHDVDTGYPTFIVTMQDLVFNFYSDEEGNQPLLQIPFVLGVFIVNYVEISTGGSVGEPPAETTINKTVSFVPQNFVGNKAKIEVGKKSVLTEGGSPVYEVDYTYQLLPNENYIIIP